MALKYNITAEEHGKLDEGLKELYSEKDGTFLLRVDGLEDVSGLKSALEKERLSVKEFKDKVKAWEALGKSPEEISKTLKEFDKFKLEPQPNPTNKQLDALRAEMAALREEQALTAERARQRERDERVSKMFDGYPEEWKSDFLSLVKGETDEEITASVKTLKERYPLRKSVGGPSSPNLEVTPDALRNRVKAMAKEAKEQSEGAGHWKGF
ncbi:MAG: hypothetical protein LBD04_02845 [Synergistaceae bacterium]|nr:hypothetical protein [Synergistaceae bacterium]